MKENSSNSDVNHRLREIDERITNLRREAEIIQDVYKQMAAFYHANALLPCNDGLIEYLQLFVEEERAKHFEGADNVNIIENLEQMKESLKQQINLLKNASTEAKTNVDQRENIVKLEDIFVLLEQLYVLPITGQQIREQMEGIEVAVDMANNKREKTVILPTQATSSIMMMELVNVMDQ